MASTKDSAPPTTTHERGACAECGEAAKAIQAPRANVGVGYTGPMYCRECNPRFFLPGPCSSPRARKSRAPKDPAEVSRRRDTLSTSAKLSAAA